MQSSKDRIMRPTTDVLDGLLNATKHAANPGLPRNYIISLPSYKIEAKS